jgi:DNA-binding MarR family transcriptional regulator
MTTLDQSQTTNAAKRVASFIEEFRKINAEMQAQQMAIFLAVAAQADLSVSEIAIVVGHSTSSVSRNVAALGKVHRKGQPGLDLLNTREDINDRRNKRVRLTPRGTRVMATLASLL